MLDSEKKILTGFLGKTLKLSDEVLASLFNEAGELTTIEPALKADEARVIDHKKENTNQYNRGLKEASTRFEKSIKDLYGVDSDKIGIDLVTEVVDLKIAEVSKSHGEIDEKHPKIIELNSKHDKILKDKEKEFQQKLEEQKLSFEKQQNLIKIKELAWAEVESKNPILPEDIKKAQTWKSRFLEEVEKSNFQFKENELPIVLDKEGKPATDAHGHMISFSDYIAEKADLYFEFPVAGTERSSGGMPPAGSGSKSQTPKPIKNLDEFNQRMKDAKTPEESANLMRQWKKQSGK